MFDKVLIANRGEIAVRIARTCRDLDVPSVAIYSDVDAEAKHVDVCDEGVHLPGVSPTDTYLKTASVLEAARTSGAQAIHPGYGFLSENADFAEAVIGAGLAWVGPPPDATRALGDKIKARQLAEKAGVPVVPGISDPVEDIALIESFGDKHGFPVAIKAAGGGGGRGLKVAHSKDEVREAFDAARRGAEAYFGSREVFVERYLEAPKHLEVQILSPAPGEAMWLGVRDCSLQRRHQKLIEETPPALYADRLAEMGAAATKLANACGYVNAGTVEMLADTNGDFYFLEVNARLQVEHTVTEEVTGIDLVAAQLKIASGDPLGFDQSFISNNIRGHSIECRINAEDPARGFIPTPGRIASYKEPEGLGIRVDAGYREGDEIPAAYDSLLAKVITRGIDREEARQRMVRALRDMKVEGVQTTIPAHLALLEAPEFIAGTHTTRTVEDGHALDAIEEEAAAETTDEAVLMVEGRAVRLWNPAMATSATAAVHGGVAGGALVAPMQGTILKVLVEEGQTVEPGDALVILEAMKMETVISATTSGTVQAVLVTAGDTATAGQVVVEVE